MIEDREIWACAQLLSDQQGEMEGHRTFVRILDRIEELEAVSPGNAVH
jgi:hypothetical protein